MLAAAVLLLLPLSASAQDSLSMRVQPLSYLSARPGTPLPVLVIIENPRASFEGVLTAQFVRNERQSSPPPHAWRQIVQIGKGRFAFMCYPLVMSDEADPSVRVVLSDPRGRLVYAHQAIPLRFRQSRLFVLAVPAAQRHLALPTLDARLLSVIPVRDPGVLPDQWYGYKSLDAVFWDASRTDRLTPDQQRALADWVCSGGRLILAACRGDSSLRSPVPSLLPSLVTDPVARPNETGLSCPDPKGSVIPRQGVSGLVRHRFGLGEVVLLGPDYSSLATASRPYLALLFGGTADALDEVAVEPESTGYHEPWRAGTHARSLLAAMAGYGFLNYTPILVTLLIYIVVVAAADYWVLRKLKRLPWTWYTFPALILAFSVISYFSFYHGGLVSLGRYDFQFLDVGRGGYQRSLALSCVRSNRNRAIHCAAPASRFLGPLDITAEYEYDYRYGRSARNRSLAPTADIVRMDGSRAVEIAGLVGSFCFFAEEWTSPPAEPPFACRLQRTQEGIEGDIVPRVKGVERAFLVVRRGSDAGRGPRIYRLTFGRDVLTFDPNRLARTYPPRTDFYHNRSLTSRVISAESWASFVAWEAERRMTRPSMSAQGATWQVRTPYASPFDSLGDDEAVILAVLKETNVSGTLPGRCVACVRQVVNIPSEKTP